MNVRRTHASSPARPPAHPTVHRLVAQLGYCDRGWVFRPPRRWRFCAESVGRRQQHRCWTWRGWPHVCRCTYCGVGL